MPRKSPWQRREFGHVSSDRGAFLERGARMTDGGTAWLIWHKVPDESVAHEGGIDYERANGKPVRSLHELSGHDGDKDEPGWYSHEYDAREPGRGQADLD